MEIRNIKKRETQRYLQQLGENLIEIMERLMNNQNLLRYLYYTDYEPLSEDKPDLVGKDLLHKQLLMIPVIGTNDDAKSKVSIKILKGLVNPDNTEFIETYFSLEIFVPLKNWVLASDNLRPYLIMGEIMRALEGKKVKGLGTIVLDSFQIQFITEEMSCYEMICHFTQFK